MNTSPRSSSNIVALSAATLLVTLAWSTSASAAEVADSAEKVRPPLLGSSAPSIELATIDGETVDLAKTIAEKPTVVIFYRGGW